VVFLGLLLVGGATLPVLATSLMPSLRERDLLITFSGTPGAARPEMSRVTDAAVTELRTLPGVARVGAHIGRAVQSDRVSDVDAVEIWVHMTPDAHHDATVAAVQEVVDGYPGLRREVRTYLGERTGSALAGTDSELMVRVYGEDSAVLDAKAGEVAQMLTGVAGVQDPVVQRVPLRPTLQVEVDLARAQQFNVKPGDVRRTVATLLAGIEVGSLFEDQKVFEVVVWGTPELRGSVTAVQDLLVERPDGAGLVRVGDVAQVRVLPAPAVIQRDSSSRYLDVTAAVEGAGTARSRPRCGRSWRASRSRSSTARSWWTTTPPGRPRSRGSSPWPSSRWCWSSSSCRPRRRAGASRCCAWPSSRPRSRAERSLRCWAGASSRSARSWACSRWGRPRSTGCSRRSRRTGRARRPRIRRRPSGAAPGPP